MPAETPYGRPGIGNGFQKGIDITYIRQIADHYIVI